MVKSGFFINFCYLLPGLTLALSNHLISEDFSLIPKAAGELLVDDQKKTDAREKWVAKKKQDNLYKYKVEVGIKAVAASSRSILSTFWVHSRNKGHCSPEGIMDFKARNYIHRDGGEKKKSKLFLILA